MIKKVKETVIGFLGDLAFFMGGVMADGFEARMQEIAAEEEAKLAEAEDEKNKLPDMGIN